MSLYWNKFVMTCVFRKPETIYSRYLI